MNITIPNYEILNFEKESLVIFDMGVSKVHSQPLLKALRQLRLSSMMTKIEMDEVLSEHGLEASSAFEFLKGIIPFKDDDAFLLRYKSHTKTRAGKN
jgi:McbB family protein